MARGLYAGSLCYSSSPLENDRQGGIMIFGAWVALVVWAAAPNGQGVDDAFEREILEALRARDPGAVPIFKAANEARSRGRLEEASAAYAEVEQRVPEYFH